MLNNGAFNPARTDRAIDLAQMFDQIEKSWRGRGAIRVNVADEIGLGPEAKAFDERAAFADGRLEFEPADLRKFVGSGCNDLQCVVAATVEDDHDLELASVIGAEILGVIAQNRSNPLLFVVSRDQ